MIEVLSIISSLLALFFIWKSYTLNKKYVALQSVVSSKINSDESETIQQQFLKFVSDSRQWAFEYIENVQSEISSIVNDMTPVIINRDNRNYNERDTLESVYKRLKTLLPEQDN